MFGKSKPEFTHKKSVYKVYSLNEKLVEERIDTIKYKDKTYVSLEAFEKIKNIKLNRRNTGAIEVKADCVNIDYLRNLAYVEAECNNVFSWLIFEYECIFRACELCNNNTISVDELREQLVISYNRVNQQMDFMEQVLKQCVNFKLNLKKEREKNLHFYMYNVGECIDLFNQIMQGVNNYINNTCSYHECAATLANIRQKINFFNPVKYMQRADIYDELKTYGY